MNGKKAFFATFFVTLSIMLACYGLLYLAIGGRTTETDNVQKGVPMMTPGPDDSRTVFVAVGDDESRFFFIVKFNGLQSKVSVVSVSPSYVYPGTGRTLIQSMEKAGVMQCVLDTKEEFGVNIDYYINCSWNGMRTLLKDFTEFGIEELGKDLPPVLKSFLLKEAEKLDADSLINAVERRDNFIDNEIGLAFINECAYLLLKYNGENLYEYAGQQLKANYNSIDTNINTEALKEFERILNFINPNVTEYLREIIISQETDGRTKVKNALLE